MASFMDTLRAMLGFKPDPAKQQEKAPVGESAAAFQTLSRQYLACENEAHKAQLWVQMCKALPDTLFLAAVCYEGENANTPVRDRSLHATVGAKRLYEANPQVTKGNPGYRLENKADKRRMHLRTVVYQKTKEEWVTLFTDFTKLLPVFGQKSRVAIISFDEAYQMARNCKGIMIDPGKDAIRLDNSELKKVL